MRKRQSSRRRVRNANSPQKEKPPDMIYLETGYFQSRLIFKKKMVKLHFLTKCFLPELALKIQREIDLLNAKLTGMKKGEKQRKSVSLSEIKQLEKEISNLSRIENENVYFLHLIEEKRQFLSGLRYTSNIH